MSAVKVIFHNQQEEKVLLSILDSLNYDYESQFSPTEETLIAKALVRSELDIKEGRTTSNSVVMEGIKLKYGI